MIERKIKIEESEDSIFLWGAGQTGKSTLEKFPQTLLLTSKAIPAHHEDCLCLS